MLPASIESSVDANTSKGHGHTIPYVYMSIVTGSNVVMSHPLLNSEPLSVGYKNCHSNIFTVYRLETSITINIYMALITASSARSSANTYNTIQAAATDETKVLKYNWIFNSINGAAQVGLFQCTVNLTEQGYTEISELLKNNGYTITQQPVSNFGVSTAGALGSIRSVQGGGFGLSSAISGTGYGIVGGSIGNQYIISWKS